MPKTMGVYIIENVETGDEYVGASSDIADRMNHHFNLLRKGIHHNQKLQNSFLKHGGKHKFRWYVAEFVGDKVTLCKREQWWMDTLKPKYNISKTAKSVARPVGIKFSAEHKQKLKDAWTLERKLLFFEFKRGKPSFNKGIKMPIGMGDKLSVSKSGRTFPMKLSDSIGKVYEFYNVNRFCRENNLNRRKIRWLLSGKCSDSYNYNGWKVLEV